MAGQKIRIKLAAYDHKMVDQATEKIVETMKKAGAKISGPILFPPKEKSSRFSVPRTNTKIPANSSK